MQLHKEFDMNLCTIDSIVIVEKYYGVTTTELFIGQMIMLSNTNDTARKIKGMDIKQEDGSPDTRTSTMIKQ